MPDDRDSVQVKVELEGAHLRVDARPARLVSQLRGGDGEPMVTAQPHGGDGLTESVPAAARQVTMRVSDELSVEATRAADFVALADEGSGRRLVVAFTGEVTVLPNGAGGDRFALSAHEALLVPAGGGDPRVVPLAELSDDEQGEITSAVEAASLAAAAPSSAETPAAEPEPEPTQEVAAIDDATTGDIVPGDTKRPPVDATPTPAKAGAGGGGGRPTEPPRRGKKGKKGRPQPPPPGKRVGPIVPAAAAAAGAGTAAAASSAAKKGAPPIKKTTTAPAKKATSGGPSKGGGSGGANRGGGGGGGGRGGSGESGGDRRFVLGAIGLAALVAIVLAVFVLAGNNGDKTAIGTNDTTTTAVAGATTTTAKPAATTTAAPAATTAKPGATTTTAKPAATTTVKAAVAASYAIEPKTCVQNGNSITYTATISNKASAAFDFTVRVVFKDSSGAAVASSDAAVNKVAAGKSVDFTATGTTSRNLANSGASCNVERVDAHPSGT